MHTATGMNTAIYAHDTSTLEAEASQTSVSLFTGPIDEFVALIGAREPCYQSVLFVYGVLSTNGPTAGKDGTDHLVVAFLPGRSLPLPP